MLVLSACLCGRALGYSPPVVVTHSPMRSHLTTMLQQDNGVDPPVAFVDSPAAFFVSKMFGEPNQGKRVAWGVFTQDVVAAEVPPEEERADLQARAAAQLVNINGDERERRGVAGTGMAALTTITAAYMVSTHASPFTRLAIGPPLFLAVGLLASKQEGL